MLLGETESGMYSPGMLDCSAKLGVVVAACCSCPPVHQETADTAMVAITTSLFGDQTSQQGYLLPNKVKTSGLHAGW